MTDLEFETVITAMNGGSVDVEVYEDVDGDSSAENTAIVTDITATGRTTHRVSGFNGSAGNTVWTEINLYGGGGGTSTPEVDGIENLQTVVPSAPVDVQQTIDSPTAIMVGWTDTSTTEEAFRIEKSVDGGAWTHVADQPAGTTSYQATVAKSADSFQWRVRAENTGGASEWAYTPVVATDGSGLTATVVSGTQIDLAWDTEQDADEYHLYRAQASSSSLADYTQIATTTAATTTHSDTGLENGEEYHYRIAPVYGGAEDDPSVDVTATTPIPAPSLDSLDASTEDQITVHYTLTDNSSDGTVEILRSTDGSTGTSVASISDLSKTSFTDTGLPDGERYYYIVRRETTHTATNSRQLAATTALPPPTLDSVTVDGDQFDLSITDNSDNEDKFVIAVAHDGGAWVENKTVAAGTTSMSTTSLLDGEEYDVRVGARTEDETSWSNVKTAKTVLPDVGTPTLGNGIEDEIRVSWADVIDNGNYRIEFKESSAATWTAHTVVSEATTSTVIPGLQDGEEYDIRVRTETEHETGTWATATITTNFPSPTNPSATLSSTNPKTAIDYSFDDHADNEDGVRVLRQREFDYGWGPWQLVEDLAPNTATGTVTGTDDTVSPGNTYRYKFEAYTEDATNESGVTSAVTTDSSGRPRERTGSSGWTVVVKHPTTGTLRPRVLDDPEILPRVNDLPQLQIPIPYDEKWNAKAFENAPLTVWKDGEKQPIDTLVDVSMQTDRSTKRTVLHGEGGRELKQSVEAEWDLKEVHTAARDLIETNTPYQADVDAPTQSFRQDVAQKTIDSQSDWQNDHATSIASDEPWTVTSDGRFQRKQTSWTMEGEAASSPEGIDQHENYSGFDALNLNALLTFGPWTFTTTHDIPAGDAEVAFRARTAGSADFVNPAFTVYLDGTEIQSYPARSITGDLAWRSEIVDFALAAGSHDITIQVTEFGDQPLYLDAVNGHDARYHDSASFPNTNLGIGGPLPGPTDYSVGTREFADASTGQQIVGGRAEATIDDTSGEQALAISNDQGQSWIEASNTDVVDGEFASASSQIRARFTLGGWGERTGVDDPTPAYGFKPQSVDLYDLYADLDETPVVINQSKDDHLDRVLRDLADQSGSIWEYRLVDGTPTVVWTQPGTRVSDVDPDLVTFDVSKQSGSIYQSVTVIGSPQSVRKHGFDANHGTTVSLSHEYLVDGSETVYDPVSGTNYDRGVDYEISYLDGMVTTLSGVR